MKNRSSLIRLHWNSANLKQGAHIHQPTAGPVPHACAQPYHGGSDSHRQLLMNGENPRLKNPYCRGVSKAVYQVPAPPNTCGSCWLETAQQFYHEMRGEGRSRVTSKLKQGTHIHQPTAWSLPHTCAQTYHAGSGSHKQLFRPYWGSSAWHSHRSVTGQKPCIKETVPSETSPLPASSTQHIWELLAGNRTAVLPRHAQARRIMGLVYVCPLL